MAVGRWRWVVGGLAGLAAVPAWAQARVSERHFVSEPFPPYTYAAHGQSGEGAGPMVDVLQAVCQKLGWRCPVEVMPWRRALGLAQTGSVHGVFAVVDTPERRAYFHVSASVIDAHYSLFARAGDDFSLQRREALVGRTIGVYGPSASVLALDELVEGLKVETVVEPDNRTVLRKLAAGRYGEHGLALVNEAVALTLIREDDLVGVQAAGTVKSFAYSFGLSRQRVTEAEFRAFNAALTQLCRSGRVAQLLKPYALPASACAKPAGKRSTP